jgi:multicomponent Na+:H+ antiporter subunit D
MKAALFAIAGLLVLRLGSARLPDLAGLGRRMPATFAALVIAGLGLIGVPPTAGFASKWALVTALVERDQWPAVAAVLVSSLLALVYVGRVVGVAWFDQPVEPRPAGSPQPPVSMVAAVWLLAGLTVYLGVGASLPVRLAEAAAAALLGTGGG